MISDRDQRTAVTESIHHLRETMCRGNQTLVNRAAHRIGLKENAVVVAQRSGIYNQCGRWPGGRHRFIRMNTSPQNPDTLALQCPFCRHEHTDDFECLDSARPDSLRCENTGCNERFSFLFRECLACGEETVFTWKTMPTAKALAGLFCGHCGAPFDEAARESQGKDAAQRVQ